MRLIALALLAAFLPFNGATAQTWTIPRTGGIGGSICPIDAPDVGHFFCITLRCEAPGQPVRLEVFAGAGRGFVLGGANPIRLLVDGAGWDITLMQLGNEGDLAEVTLPPEFASTILERLSTGASAEFQWRTGEPNPLPIPLTGAAATLAPVAAQCGAGAAQTAQAAQTLHPVDLRADERGRLHPQVAALVQEAHGARMADQTTLYRPNTVHAARAFDIGQGRWLLFARICPATREAACFLFVNAKDTGAWADVFSDPDIAMGEGVFVDLGTLREGWPDIVIRTAGVRWIRQSGAYTVAR